MSEFLNNLYSNNFVKTSRSLRKLKMYNGVKISLEMVLTYDLIASFNRDQRMSSGHVRRGTPSAFGQAELADFLMCSIKTVGRTITAMKKARMIECIGRGPHDVDLLVCLPLEEECIDEATPVDKPSATRNQRVISTQPEETVENAGTNQPGTVECGHKGHDMDSKKPDRSVALDNSGHDVRGAANDAVSGDAANDDVRSNSPVPSPVSGNKVIMLNGQTIAYTEPDNIDFGDPF